MKATATHSTQQENESHRGSFIQRAVDPMVSEEEEMPFISAKRLGIQTKLRSSSDRFIQRQEGIIESIESWGKRWIANGMVINLSSRRVRVWSSDRQGTSHNIEDGLYWIDANSESSWTGEDVDHVQDHFGQWYKIGAGRVVVQRDGSIRGARCRVLRPGLDCPSTGTTSERSDLDIAVPSSGGLQAKLIVGAPNDHYEQEADAMAEHVMRMPLQLERAPMISRFHPGNPLQRMCSECEEEMQVQRICDDCEEEMAVQRSESGGGESHASSHIAGRLQSRQGQGSPLPPAVQAQMGQSFGTDFSNVRIHTDAEASQMSQDLNAQAFTHGSDIYFNRGKYNPGTSGGQRLLAHELTHTVQQGKVISTDSRAYDSMDHRTKFGNRSMLIHRPTKINNYALTDYLQRFACYDLMLAEARDNQPRENQIQRHIYRELQRQQRRPVVTELHIPAGSATQFRDVSSPIIGQQRTGEGRADIAMLNSPFIELLELKYCDQEGIPFADTQIQNYVDIANTYQVELAQNFQARLRRQQRRIVDVPQGIAARKMPMHRIELEPVTINGSRVLLVWCADGIIGFKAIRSELPEPEGSTGSIEARVLEQHHAVVFQFSRQVSDREAIMHLWPHGVAVRDPIIPQRAESGYGFYDRWMFNLDVVGSEEYDDLVSSIREDLRTMLAYILRIPLYSATPFQEQLPVWITAQVRYTVLDSQWRDHLNQGISVVTFQGVDPWGSQVVWVNRSGNYYHFAFYQEFPSDLTFYEETTNLNETEARLLRNVCVQYNRDMELLVIERSLNPRAARDIIMQSDNEVLRILLIELSFLILDTAAAYRAVVDTVATIIRQMERTALHQAEQVASREAHRIEARSRDATRRAERVTYRESASQTGPRVRIAEDVVEEAEEVLSEEIASRARRVSR